MRKRKILISCGGTGGHIFPAIEIAKSFKTLNPDIDLLFVGALNKMEMIKVPKAGFPIIGIWIQGLYRNSIFKNTLFFIKLVVSLIHSFGILIYYRPVAVIGTGGFVTGPVLLLASMLGLKTYIQEQNCFPGITNRILGKLVSRVFVAHEQMESFFAINKIINFGNPVRLKLRTKKSDDFVNQSRSFFGLSPNKFTILVIGGSLGAEPINKSIAYHLKSIFKQDCQLIWQTGYKGYGDYGGLKSTNCSVQKFIDRMDLAYSAADVVISRAGAIAITEISFLEKASILIPSPHVTDNHQFKNAKYLADHKACLLMSELEFMSPKVIEYINYLKSDNIRNSIGKNAHNLFKYNASSEIAALILKDIKAKK